MPMKRGAGKFDKRVIIERVTETTSTSMNNQTKTFEAIATRLACVVWLRGNEVRNGSAMQVQDSAEWSVELLADSVTRTITSNDRLVYRGKVFSITSSADINQDDRTITILCKERKKP